MTPTHLKIVIRPLAPDEAVAVAAWRYGGELAIYDGDPGQEQDLLVMTAEGYGYYALLENDDFVGYCCFGPEGRVPGQPAPVEDLLDLGGGLRPDLVGKGLGALGLPMILDFRQGEALASGIPHCDRLVQPTLDRALSLGWIPTELHIPRAWWARVH